MRSINSIVEGIVNRYLLNEMVSDVVYHFTHIYNIKKILESNVIRLSTSISSRSDAMHKSKLFFLSTTRQFNGKVGYSYGREARIELDGRLLNQRYEGRPVDYWGTMDKEYEDRLFSSEPYITGANKYIRRISIFADDEKQYYDIQQCIKLANGLGIEIAVFEDEREFNNPKSNKTINSKILSMELTDPMAGWKTDNGSQNMYRGLTDIIRYCVRLDNVSPDEIDGYVRKLFKKYGIDDDVEKYISIMNQDFNSSVYILPNINARDLKMNPHYGLYSKMISDVLRRHGLTNTADADVYYDRRKYQKSADHYENFDTDKTVRVLCWSQGEGQYRAIVNPDETPFWSLFEPYVKERFIERLTNHDYDYGVRSHKSKDNESFNKYIKHLTMNPRISVNEMLRILNRIDYYEDDIIDDIFWGRFVERDINYWDCWKYAYTPEEEKQLKELFRKK